MKKRMLAIAVTVMMMIAVLAGCTTTDIGMLNFYSEITSVKSAEVSGTVDLTMDQKAIKEYITSLGGDFSSIPFDEIDLGNKMSLSFTGKLDYNNKLGVDLNLNATIKDKNISLGNLILQGDKGIYISKEYFLGIMDIIFMFDPEMSEYAYTVKNAANQVLGDAKYIQIADVSDMAQMGTAYIDQQYVLGQKEIDFLSNAFKNYSPGCVTQVANGYKTSLTLEQLFNVCKGSIEYIVNNNDEFIAALTTYINSGSMEKYGLDKETSAELISMIKENKMLLISQLNTLKGYVDTIMVSDEFKDFAQSSYTTTTTKVGGAYNTVENVNVILKGKSLLKIDGVSKTIPAKVTVNGPAGTVVSLEDFVTSWEKKLSAENPIVKAEIVWDKYDTMAMVQYSRKADLSVFGGNDSNEDIPYKIVSGSIYLPLRSIGEAFGEEVGWDNKAKKAYIVRDGKNIEMQGMVADGKTFIKIRDFEKLGYKVDYKKISGVNIATLAR